MVNSGATTKKITQKYIVKQAKRELKWNTRKYLCNTKVSNEGTEEQKWHRHSEIKQQKSRHKFSFISNDVNVNELKKAWSTYILFTRNTC